MLAQRFGFELEAVGVPYDTFVNRYDDRFYIDNHRFRVDEDGSVEGIEVKSPVLTHSEISIVDSVVEYLSERGMSCDDTCGLHIHVEMADEYRSFDKINALWAKCKEDTLKKFPIKRNRANYAGYGEIKSSADYSYSSYYKGTVKYSAIHIHPELPTLEFRLFNGRMSASYIKRAIETSLGFCNKLIIDNL